MSYRLKLEAENGSVIAEREFDVSGDHEITQAKASLKAKELALDAIHHAAINGIIGRNDASAAVVGATSITSAARI
jgi:hypothetical protein